LHCSFLLAADCAQLPGADPQASSQRERAGPGDLTHREQLLQHDLRGGGGGWRPVADNYGFWAREVSLGIKWAKKIGGKKNSEGKVKGPVRQLLI